MTQRTVLFLGGSMSGIRIPEIDVPRDGVLVIAVPEHVPARYMQEMNTDISPSVSFNRETYKQVMFGMVEAELMVLEGLSPYRALGQYLRGEPVR